MFKNYFIKYQFSSVAQLCPTLCDPWTAACQASLPITNSQILLKLMSINLVIPSNHLILCHPLLLLPSIFPNIRVFSNESVVCIRWPKYWNFSFGISYKGYSLVAHAGPSCQYFLFLWYVGSVRVLRSCES